MPRGDARRKRCAVYTRKSSEEGLEQEFNSLAAQREACEAYIRSERNEGWVLARTHYDDGGFSGGNLERPALQDLLADIRAGRIDIVVVYNVARLPGCVVCCSDAAVQHDEVDGAPDAQCTVVFCAVRARGHRRTHP